MKQENMTREDKIAHSLELKRQKENQKPYIVYGEEWLKSFDELDKCDQKVLAVLYWERLSDDQKKVFDDYEYMEHQKFSERRELELMTDPVKLRKRFLEGASPILSEILGFASGKKVKSDFGVFAMKEVWDVLKSIIMSASDTATPLSLKGKDISDQIDEILTNVSNGNITIDEAKEYISLVSAGFNLQQLPKLMQKLEEIESK